VVLCLAPPLWGCSHDYGTLGGTGGAGGAAECPAGSETCACFPAKTCQTGLTCASNLCVRVGGTGGSSGAGGNIGPGGSVGSGGNIGPGGSIGSGGNIGPGGSIGSGGSVVVGSGGSVGSGGASGAGGLGPPANNQIVNGDFNSGSSAPWHVTNGSGSPSTDTTSVVTNGQFCVTEPNTYAPFNIGWPTTNPPVAVFQASTTYEFFYQISTTAPLYSFSAKVGSAPGGSGLTHLMTTGTQGEPTAGAGLQTFAFTFVPGADPTAGVVFLLYSGASPTTVCIDNVALGTPL
jgi:hypothetical protein